MSRPYSSLDNPRHFVRIGWSDTHMAFKTYTIYSRAIRHVSNKSVSRSKRSAAYTAFTGLSGVCGARHDSGMNGPQLPACLDPVTRSSVSSSHPTLSNPQPSLSYSLKCLPPLPPPLKHLAPKGSRIGLERARSLAFEP